jgi:putative redox protein
MAITHEASTVVTEGVEVRETGAGRFQLEIRTGGTQFFADEPSAAGGLGSGPTPYDLLSSALGACTAMTVRLYAERKGWTLKEVFVRVVHRREGLQAKDRFAREIRLEGDLSFDQRRRLLEIAERCPVHLTLERGSEVVTVLAEQPLAGHLDPEPMGHMTDMVEACEEGPGEAAVAGSAS